MISVDTNVIVRLVTRDHAAQLARAAAVFRTGQVFVAKSVLLETEWVLRYSYKLETGAIVRALKGVLGLPNVSVEDPATVVVAIRLYEQRLDFADALHVASSAHTDRFITFDARLVKSARRASLPVALA